MAEIVPFRKPEIQSGNETDYLRLLPEEASFYLANYATESDTSKNADLTKVLGSQPLTQADIAQQFREATLTDVQARPLYYLALLKRVDEIAQNI